MYYYRRDSQLAQEHRIARWQMALWALLTILVISALVYTSYMIIHGHPYTGSAFMASQSDSIQGHEGITVSTSSEK